MKNKYQVKYYYFLLIIMIFGCKLSYCTSNSELTQPEKVENTIVGKYGQLSFKGNKLVDQNGELVILRGMSLFWSQWGGQYYNEETIKWLRDDWNCTIIRAAMGIEEGGYLENPEYEIQKIKTVIDACIKLGIYVIVDWHDHRAENHIEESLLFFSNISEIYGEYPNIIYEIYNEPLNVSWNNDIKPYAETIISAIRKNDKNNIIIVGTPNWAQDVDKVIDNKILFDNVAYTFHFYTSTHSQDLRDKAIKAINADIPIFVSEWGVSEASGDGNINLEETNIWADFLEQYSLSWCNWSIVNKDETSAALLSTTLKISNWNESELSNSGKIIRDYLIRMNKDLFEDTKK